MISLEEAKELAVSCVAKNYTHPIAIIDGSTVERPFGWIFFYDSANYLRSGEVGKRLVGKAPIIVNRHTGTISRTSTAFSVEEHIEAYEVLGPQRYDAGEWREYLKRYVTQLDE